MAGLTPFFLTGANAKIILNNQTIALATDFSYRITVKHAAPRLLGKYETEDPQPLAYDVVGSFSIIRYARGLKNYIGNGVPNGVENRGNGVGSWGFTGMSDIKSALGIPNSSGQFDGKADESFNPSRFFQSKTFNIEVRQKIKTSDESSNSNNVVGVLVNTIKDKLNKITSNRTAPIKPGETVITMIRHARITEGDFKINKRGVAIQTFNFQAVMVDDDTYIARKSGVGQEIG